MDVAIVVTDGAGMVAITVVGVAITVVGVAVALAVVDGGGVVDGDGMVAVAVIGVRVTVAVGVAVCSFPPFVAAKIIPYCPTA